VEQGVQGFTDDRLHYGTDDRALDLGPVPALFLRASCSGSPWAAIATRSNLGPTWLLSLIDRPTIDRLATPIERGRKISPKAPSDCSLLIGLIFAYTSTPCSLWIAMCICAVAPWIQ